MLPVFLIPPGFPVPAESVGGHAPLAGVVWPSPLAEEERPRCLHLSKKELAVRRAVHRATVPVFSPAASAGEGVPSSDVASPSPVLTALGMSCGLVPERGPSPLTEEEQPRWPLLVSARQPAFRRLRHHLPASKISCTGRLGADISPVLQGPLGL